MLILTLIKGVSERKKEEEWREGSERREEKRREEKRREEKRREESQQWQRRRKGDEKGEEREGDLSFNMLDLFPKPETPRINIDDQIKEVIHMSRLDAMYHS